MKLRHNPLIAAILAADAIKTDGERLAQELGRPVTQYEAFLTHFRGYTGRLNFVKAVERTQNKDIRKIIPVAFSKNRSRLPQPQANERITAKSTYNHLITMLETRRNLYLQLLRLDVRLKQDQQITRYLKAHER